MSNRWGSWPWACRPSRPRTRRSRPGWLRAAVRVWQSGWLVWTWGSQTQVWQAVMVNLDTAWQWHSTAARASNPLALVATQSWNGLHGNLPGGSGCLNGLVAARRRVGGRGGEYPDGGHPADDSGAVLLLGPASLLIPNGGLSFGGYINSE